MGLFDIFSRKSALEKHAERAGNKRAQNPDRWESIQFLGKLATTTPPEGAKDERAAAVAALLQRFGFYVDPSITDGEEKDEAFRWVCEARDVAIDPVRAAMRSHESLSWPLKALEHLVDEDRLLVEMTELLATMDTEYLRDPQRKIQLLSTLEGKRHRGIAAAVQPFFSDVNEEARFHAIATALAQDDADEILPSLREALAEEESVRVKVRALDLLAERGLSLGDAKGVVLPDGYVLDAKGVPKKTPRKK